jgi:hypothetical protein
MTVSENIRTVVVRLTRVGSDRLQLVYRNARQMKKIVEAQYSGLYFDEGVIDAQGMGFECSPTVCVLIFDQMRPANSTQGTLDRRPVASMPMARRAEEYKKC